MDIARNVCLCACALETCAWHRVCYRIFDMQQNKDVNEGPQRGDGLYRREYEHDACGVGMVANLSGEASHDIVEKGMTILKRLMHRGATGNDPRQATAQGFS